jgi:glutamine synthetase
LALCEGYLADKKTPAAGNFRYLADRIMKEAAGSDPWFGKKKKKK